MKITYAAAGYALFALITLGPASLGCVLVAALGGDAGQSASVALPLLWVGLVSDGWGMGGRIADWIDR